MLASLSLLNSALLLLALCGSHPDSVTGFRLAGTPGRTTCHADVLRGPVRRAKCERCPGERWSGMLSSNTSTGVNSTEERMFAPLSSSPAIRS